MIERKALLEIIDLTKAFSSFSETYRTIQAIAEKGLENEEREWCYFEITFPKYALIKSYSNFYAILLYEKETGESVINGPREVSKDYALTLFTKSVFEKAWSMGRDVQVEMILSAFGKDESSILILKK